MAARSVRWCSTLRRPPVSSRSVLSSRAQQLGRGHRPGPGRGQLDRQRDAVEPAADLLDVAPGAAGSNVGERRGALVEQLGGRPWPDRVRRRDQPLAADAEPLPRRGEHVDLGAPSTTASASAAAPSMTCSQLSSTSRAAVRSAATTAWVRARPGLSWTSRTSATARATSPRRDSASSTSQPTRRRRPGPRPARAGSCRCRPARRV